MSTTANVQPLSILAPAPPLGAQGSRIRKAQTLRLESRVHRGQEVRRQPKVQPILITKRTL